MYDTLEEFVICGASWFPVSELSQRLKQKSIKDAVTKMNEYQKEYQQICKQTPRFTIGDCAGGHRADNREKNRDVLIVPRKLMKNSQHFLIILIAIRLPLQLTISDRISPVFKAIVLRIT